MDDEKLHVFDLPQLYQHPPLDTLLTSLSLLRQRPTTFLIPGAPFARQSSQVGSVGVAKYLTDIVSNPLTWITNETDRERLWDLASLCLSERSGRAAQPDMTRTFNIPLNTKRSVIVAIREPAYTSDNIGLKTWSSSYVLAQYLHYLVQPKPSSDDTASINTVLELGSGTGLLGIAAALIWKRPVILTDLPSIEPNLSFNVDFNRGLLRDHAISDMQSGVLDWTSPSTILLRTPEGSFRNMGNMTFHTILVADPVYSDDHPGLVAGVVEKTLAKSPTTARLITILPQREGYSRERSMLEKALMLIGLNMIDGRTHRGYDDWGPVENPTETDHYVGIWAWRSEVQKVMLEEN